MVYHVQLSRVTTGKIPLDRRVEASHKPSLKPDLVVVRKGVARGEGVRCRAERRVFVCAAPQCPKSYTVAMHLSTPLLHVVQPNSCLQFPERRLSIFLRPYLCSDEK